MTRAKAQRTPSINKITNSKLEIRNSKQIQIIKKHKIPNNLVLDLDFWICVFRFVSDFELRNSDFNSMASWREILC